MNKELESGTLEIPCKIEMIGSCTALIVRDCLEKGYNFDVRLCRILYSAMLLDTENRVPHKMTETDVEIMDLILSKAEIASTELLYEVLMHHLLSERDGKRLYQRDYKHYYGFGFAVLKVTNMIDEPGLEEWLETVFAQAREDNLRNNDYFTLVKLVDYEANGLKVHKERLYWVWNQKKNTYLMEKLQELICSIVKCCMPGGTIVCNEDYVEISDIGKQLSRKKIVPAIEALVGCCGQYAYIERLGKWVAKDFLKVNDTVKALLPDVKMDAKGRVCNISFLQSKALMQQMGMSMLSLKEYWKVYEEAKKKHDTALSMSLVDSDFLEFLDTCCIEGVLVHKPVVLDGHLTKSEDIYEGEILYANPGLIRPTCIDGDTGLPSQIFSAANYHDKSLWRYWSPMADKTYIFSRSYIFLLQQPCLDAKSTPEESFVNIGIRPVRDKNLEVDVVIEQKNQSLILKYKSEYDEDYEVVYAMVE